jgi:hypothetical protein
MTTRIAGSVAMPAANGVMNLTGPAGLVWACADGPAAADVASRQSNPSRNHVLCAVMALSLTGSLQFDSETGKPISG